MGIVLCGLEESRLLWLPKCWSRRRTLLRDRRRPGVEEAATASNSPAALLSLLAKSNLSAAILSLSYPQVSVSSEARPGAAKTRGGEVPPPW